jgi:hypothetical protein
VYSLKELDHFSGLFTQPEGMLVLACPGPHQVWNAGIRQADPSPQQKYQQSDGTSLHNNYPLSFWVECFWRSLYGKGLSIEEDKSQID